MSALLWAGGSAWAATGSLNASPATIVVPDSQSLGATQLSWSGSDAGSLHVTVRVDDQPEVLFASTGLSGAGEAGWIQVGHRYVFILRADSPSGAVLSQVDVRAVTPSGQLTASPSFLTLPAGQALGSTQLSWHADNVFSAHVTVSVDGGAEALFASTGPQGSGSADWIQAGHDYLFRLRANAPSGPVLSQVPVRAVMAAAPPPVLTGATSGGSDGYTVTLTGSQFAPNAVVDVRAGESGPIIGQYNAELTRQGSTSLSFYVGNAEQRALLNGAGLYCWVVNPGPQATWSSPQRATRSDAGVNAHYQALPQAAVVDNRQATVLNQAIALSQAAWVFVASDGTLAPQGGSRPVVTTELLVNGQAAGNVSAIRWNDSRASDEHSYNNIAAVWLAAGTHQVGLRVTAAGGAVRVAQRSNLSVLAHPAGQVTQTLLGADSEAFEFSTGAIANGPRDDRTTDPAGPIPLPYREVVASHVPVAPGQPVVVLGSGVLRQAGHDGDPLVGLWVNDTQSSGRQAMAAVTDIWEGAERRAPVSVQGYFNLPAGTHKVALGASELYWSDAPPTDAENPAKFLVEQRAALIAMSGGMRVHGVAVDAGRFSHHERSMLNVAPTRGVDAVLARAEIDIPADHAGAVFFSAKARTMGANDSKGTDTLRLRIDGQFVGSVGRQTCSLTHPNCVSTRVLTASYLSSGAGRLAPGRHTVEVVGRFDPADGSTGMRFMSLDAPLVWFD